MHTILHIGAGQVSELSQWLESGAQNIVLVEPNPILAEKLRKQTAGAPEITVVEAAITTNTGNNELSEYNLPEASSLRAATGLKTLFPGLKAVNIHIVATLTPLQLIEQHGPTPGQLATLALQAPGEEYSILQALIETDQLKHFGQLVITTNLESLYQGSTDAKTLLNTLEKYGYDIIREDQKDPDWPTLHLQRNPLKDQIRQLKQELQKAQAENQQALAEHAQASAEREKTLEQQLNAVKQKLTHADSAFSATVQAEHRARKLLNQLRAELGEKSQRIEDMEEANRNLKQELDAAKNSNTGLNEENAKLNSRTQSLETESQNERARLKASKQLVESAQKEAAQLRETSKADDKNLETHNEGLKQAEKKAQQLAEDLKKERSAHQETTKSLADHTQWFQSRKQQAEELQAQNGILKQQLQTVSQEKQQVLEAQGNGQQALGDLEAKMEKLFSQQADQLRQATNAVGQHVTQSFNTQRQQFQAATSLSTYLETGEQPVDFGGWAISADLAGHLVRAIEQNQYDLIIEFGSGSSTVLMAKAIQNTLAGSAESLRNSALQYDGANQGQPSGSAKALEASSQYDLPERILSFEQNQDYAAQTQAALASSGLSNLVDLVLAPLVPIGVPIKAPTSLDSQQSAQPLFYDCEQKLANIAQLFSERAANILVLIDGPHSPRGEPLIREPALATVLQYLSAHQLHIVLDDAQRQGEKQVTQDWLQLCTVRGLRYQQTEVNTEKGALWLTINPQG
ncbi:hypothetical protein [Marinobacter sp. LV10MA510-1]|uniref:hypothetical protein n=1 Tax=Marinobacter sp. LV10MA510-1 TaxID=1415567 RepID=UPI000BF407BC|nr:hypothetical protein [Marinobacter sp. LV10MA510-1]PFG08985.1 FkbM family methyltransferase [Marinobacter sp. LV10MA510-1]